MLCTVRIGTWNLAGRWTGGHEELLLRQDVDVWLLTEVSERVVLDGYAAHATRSLMTARRHWAAILTRGELKPLDDPHPASVAATVDGVMHVSSVLPWKAAGAPEVWGGTDHASKMAATISALETVMSCRDVVWGGDWNQSLQGREYAGSNAGRTRLLDTLDRLGLVVPTSVLAHRIKEISSIDHIAVRPERPVHSVARCDASGLSDHDAYVVELGQPSSRDWSGPDPRASA